MACRRGASCAHGGRMLRAPLYFPVDVPPLMPGRQPRLGGDGAGTTHLERDDELSEYLAAKSHPVRASASLPDEERVLAWLNDTMVHEHRVEPAATLDEAVRGIQEDLVIMRRRTGTAEAADAIAVYLHVSLPTGWCPDCACG